MISPLRLKGHVLGFSMVIGLGLFSWNSWAKPAGAKKGAKKVNIIMEIEIGGVKKGNIELELDPAKAPLTVKNFEEYVKEKFFDGTVFHRVINGFMIQGGGFTENLKQKPTKAPVKNESEGGLKNDAGTIAMARTTDPHSATSQFFINHKDNDSLNFRPGAPGYTVFGKVTSGMNLVNAIAAGQTHGAGPFQTDVPVKAVVIKSIRKK